MTRDSLEKEIYNTITEIANSDDVAGNKVLIGLLTQFLMTGVESYVKAEVAKALKVISLTY